jgi:hypothetical protein
MLTQSDPSQLRQIVMTTSAWKTGPRLPSTSDAIDVVDMTPDNIY